MQIYTISIVIHQTKITNSLTVTKNANPGQEEQCWRFRWCGCFVSNCWIEILIPAPRLTNYFHMQPFFCQSIVRTKERKVMQCRETNRLALEPQPIFFLVKKPSGLKNYLFYLLHQIRRLLCLILKLRPSVCLKSNSCWKIGKIALLLLKYFRR